MYFYEIITLKTLKFLEAYQCFLFVYERRNVSGQNFYSFRCIIIFSLFNALKLHRREMILAKFVLNYVFIKTN